MRILSAAVVVILHFASNSYAVCSKTVFSCYTKNGKQIEVCDTGNSFEYSFGRAANIEKNIKQPKSGSYLDISATAGYGCSSIEFPSGNTLYTVSSCPDKFGNQAGGVEVKSNGKRVAEILCDDKKGIISNLSDY